MTVEIEIFFEPINAAVPAEFEVKFGTGMTAGNGDIEK